MILAKFYFDIRFNRSDTVGFVSRIPPYFARSQLTILAFAIALEEFKKLLMQGIGDFPFSRYQNILLIKSGNWLQIVTIAALGGNAAAVPCHIFIAVLGIL